ncbi:MAG TPA: GAF domain-containing protein [Rhizobacter sp.]|nr:GAF domain-containing protein [Rhizobacter sp.]
MKAFNDLLADVGAQLDADTLTLQGAALRMAEFIQQAIACSRMSVWMLEGEGEARAMSRLVGYDGDTRSAITEPAWLRGAEFADYFSALTSKGLYVCNDAWADPNMAGMRESYLVPNDIRASLDVTIGVNGTTWAVYCCAQRGATRQWTPQEMRLLRRFADAVSVRRARRRRREAEAASLMQRLLEEQVLPVDVTR